MPPVNENDTLQLFDNDMRKFRPKDIVELLDQYIVGQDRAKRLVALALRNRMRRKLVPVELREEIAPKNILMIGPTGVGKTEIARRISQLVDAPFVKVEATKFTERGYVGRDVEYMIRALVNHSVNRIKSRMRDEVRESVIPEVNKLLQKAVWSQLSEEGEVPEFEMLPADKRKFRSDMMKKLSAGEYDNTVIEIKVKKKPVAIFPMIDMFPGMDDVETNFQSLFGGEGGMETEEKRKMTVKDARDTLTEQFLDERIDKDKAIQLGLKWAQEMGIIFLDEIDKIADKASGHGPDVSREGVQRDLLPIVEGTTVSTKYGVIKTDHILFIAAGAFHISKPSDMIPELQGRFPIRVEMESLTRADLKRILVEPKSSLIRQYTELLETEGVKITFNEAAYDKIAELAFEINSTLEDIGARRLHTIMEFLMEDISFNAPDMPGEKVKITSEYVKERLSKIIKDSDVTKYIL
ncbi:MAG: HslU--HslV peptidase ATPase subunit [Spirochaetes bacterium GWF1_49_6]|nr:MAG: HslU--HslV peptidase ATPase subunit [Spirochaetes bacterium GWF1_49_6]